MVTHWAALAAELSRRGFAQEARRTWVAPREYDLADLGYTWIGGVSFPTELLPEDLACVRAGIPLVWDPRGSEALGPAWAHHLAGDLWRAAARHGEQHGFHGYGKAVDGYCARFAQLVGELDDGEGRAVLALWQLGGEGAVWRWAQGRSRA